MQEGEGHDELIRFVKSVKAVLAFNKEGSFSLLHDYLLEKIGENVKADWLGGQLANDLLLGIYIQHFSSFKYYCYMSYKDTINKRQSTNT